MKVDLYKRPENGGEYSYLAVPEGLPIPEEATNTDWETVCNGEELRAEEFGLLGVSPDEMEDQIQDKGYAISSAKKHIGML